MAQSATAEVKQAFRTSPIRRKLKLLIDWIAKGDTPGTITAGEWSATYFSKDNAYNGSSSNMYKPFVLSDSMSLGRNVRFMSTKYEFGWHGANRSDVNGAFGSPEVISMIYDSVQTVTDLTVLSSIYNYLVDFDLYYRDSTNTSWVLCDNYTGVTSEFTGYPFGADTDIKGWKIEISKISLADMMACVIEVQSGFQEDISQDIINFNISKELSYDSGATLSIGNISANSLSVKLRNDHQKYNPKNVDSPVYQYLKPNRAFRPFIGIDMGTEIIYFAQGVFYMRQLLPNPDMTADISAVDRMFFLNEEEFVSSELYEDYKISELVQLIVEDAGLSALEYDIDDTINTIPFAWFEPRRHIEDIKRLAMAEGGLATFDELGVFNFKSRNWVGGSIEATFSDKEIIKGTPRNPFNASNMKNYISIKSNPLTAGSDTQIFSSTETITIAAGASLSLACYFSVVPCKDVGNASITKDAEITLTEERKYAYGTYLELTNTAGTSKTITSITINGKPLTNTGSKHIVSKDDVLIAKYKKSEYKVDSEFIQEIAYAQTLADDLLLDNKDPDPDIEFESLCLPYLQVGDLIAVRCDKLNIGGDL